MTASAKALHAPPPPWRKFCWPALLPWAVLAWEAAYAYSGLDWGRRALFAHLYTVRWLGYVLCASGLALCLVKAARQWFFEQLDEGPGAWHLGPWVAAAGIFAYLSHLYLVRFFAFSLHISIDNADAINLVWGMLHGEGTYSVIRGVDILSIHFHLTQALMAPFLVLLPRPWVMHLAQALLLASAGFCAFHFAKRLTGSNCAGWVGMLLIYASPAAIHIIRSGFLMQVWVAPFFLWAAYLSSTGRFWPALAAWGAFLGCSEHAAITFAGFGVYRAVSAGREGGAAGLFRGLGIAALGLFLFGAEMRIKAAKSPHEGHRAHYENTYYGHLGQGPGRMTKALATLVSPSAQKHSAILLLCFALLPLAAGRPLIVLACAALPQILADPSTGFHRYESLQASYIFGPAAWCALAGSGALLEALRARAAQAWLAPSILLLLGAAHLGVRIPFYDFFSPADARTMGAALREVPSEASVWTETSASPALALRRRIKLLSAPTDDFTRDLFLPEYVLMKKTFMTEPQAQRITTLLARERYQKIFDADNIVVLRHPSAPFSDGSTALTLPESASGEEEAFRNHIFRPPDSAQDRLRDYYRSRLGWKPWIAFASELGRAVPARSVLIHSGRHHPLPPLLREFAGIDQLALSETLDAGGNERSVERIRKILAICRSQGTPTYTLGETFAAGSMTYLLRGWRLTKSEAESLMAPYRPVVLDKLSLPGEKKTALLLMVPTAAAQARRLGENLRKAGFGSQAEKAGL